MSRSLSMFFVVACALYLGFSPEKHLSGLVHRCGRVALGVPWPVFATECVCRRGRQIAPRSHAVFWRPVLVLIARHGGPQYHPSCPTGPHAPPAYLFPVICRRRACPTGAQAHTDDGPCSPHEDPTSAPPDAAAGVEGGREGEVAGVVVEEGGFGARAAAGAGEGEGWVQLLSVTSDNPQFHPASFQPQALPPEGETSFQASI